MSISASEANIIPFPQMPGKRNDFENWVHIFIYYSRKNTDNLNQIILLTLSKSKTSLISIINYGPVARGNNLNNFILLDDSINNSINSYFI
jgi:hypothetical protein